MRSSIKSLDPAPALGLTHWLTASGGPGLRLGGWILWLDPARGGARGASIFGCLRQAFGPREESCSAQGACEREEGCSAQCASAVARTHCAGGKWCGKRRGSVVWTLSLTCAVHVTFQFQISWTGPPDQRTDHESCGFLTGGLILWLTRSVQCHHSVVCLSPGLP